MAEGYHDFSAGEDLTAANLEDYTELQAIMRFASAAAGNTALASVLIEGLRRHLKDLNVDQIYSGSAWSTFGPLHGALTSFTPAITQSGGVAATVARATYSRVGRLIIGDFLLSVTGAGTISTEVRVSLPVNPASGSTNTTMGQGFIVDTSTGIKYDGFVDLAASSPGAIRFRVAGGDPTAYLGTDGFTLALASGDVVSGQFMYEAAADA